MIHIPHAAPSSDARPPWSSCKLHLRRGANPRTPRDSLSLLSQLPLASPPTCLQWSQTMTWALWLPDFPAPPWVCSQLRACLPGPTTLFGPLVSTLSTPPAWMWCTAGAAPRARQQTRPLGSRPWVWYRASGLWDGPQVQWRWCSLWTVARGHLCLRCTRGRLRMEYWYVDIASP